MKILLWLIPVVWVAVGLLFYHTWLRVPELRRLPGILLVTIVTWPLVLFLAVRDVRNNRRNTRKGVPM